MKILAAINVVLRLLGALISTGQDRDGYFSLVRELLTQLNSLGAEALSRLMQRASIVREILTRVNIPTLAEFQEFLDSQILPWLPKPPRTPTLPKGNWRDERLKVQRRAWSKIGIELPQDLCEKFLAVLNQCGAELVANLEAYGFMFVITPDVTWTADTWPTKWTKLGDWYWQMLNGGRIIGSDKLPITACRLMSNVLLIDTRQKPDYINGWERWEKDVFMEALIGQLQDQNKLSVRSDRGGRGSRFYLSRNDYIDVIAPAFMEALRQLGVPVQTTRLEYCPEHSVLCQLFNLPRKGNGKTQSWLWFQECLRYSSDQPLHGGHLIHGGLADVGFENSVFSTSGTISGSLVAVLG